MKNSIEIVEIEGLEVLDSRGLPTVRAKVTLADGSVGIATVPSGASTGKYEAHELRDTESGRYHGKGVLQSIDHIERIIRPALIGISATDHSRADHIMITLDGVRNKSNLGANTILSVSIAIAKAAAQSLKIPLYRYLGGFMQGRLPVPMMNIINGGVHSSNPLDIQEFMILPIGASSFAEGVRICSETYHCLKKNLKSMGLSVSVGDEGGFAPDFQSAEEAIEAILHAAKCAGYHSGEDLVLGLDIAAGAWYENGNYHLPKSGECFSWENLLARYKELCEKYPIYSMEDPFAEDDRCAWKRITEMLSAGRMLVGDDLFVTNTQKLREGIKDKIGNAILIKPNQIGTLSETAAAVALAKRNGYRVILSHRSGDTADTAIADMAVAFGADFIKSGAPCRSERCEKYNRLLEIENELFASYYGEAADAQLY